MQIVEIELDPSEGVRAEVGAMMFMEEGIQMETGTGGGIFKGLKRMLTGDGFFICTFYNTANLKRCVSFGAPYPGKIIALDLRQVGGTFICQKDSFLCAANGIDIDIAFTKRMGAGLFGGEGFVLQRLTGDGLAFVHGGGMIIKRELRSGERLRVDTGCIVAYTSQIDFDIEFVKGIRNWMFGGEGLFFAKMTGPGKVWLQSLPISRLAGRLQQYTYKRKEEGSILGGLGNLLDGRE